MDIQINVNKKIDEMEESSPVSLTEQKKLSKMLSYFLFTPNEQPQFLQEKQNREYIKHEAKIQWIKAFKDVYQKLVKSSSQMKRKQVAYDKLDMPCFYIRNASFIALFRVDEEMEGVVVAELIANENLTAYIKRRGLISYSIHRIYEDE